MAVKYRPPGLMNTNLYGSISLYCISGQVWPLQPSRLTRGRLTNAIVCSCLAEPRALIVRPRPPGGLEPPEPKVRQLGGLQLLVLGDLFVRTSHRILSYSYSMAV